MSCKGNATHKAETLLVWSNKLKIISPGLFWLSSFILDKRKVRDHMGKRNASEKRGKSVN